MPQNQQGRQPTRDIARGARLVRETAGMSLGRDSVNSYEEKGTTCRYHGGRKLLHQEKPPLEICLQFWGISLWLPNEGQLEEIEANMVEFPLLPRYPQFSNLFIRPGLKVCCGEGLKKDQAAKNQNNKSIAERPGVRSNDETVTWHDRSLHMWPPITMSLHDRGAVWPTSSITTIGLFNSEDFIDSEMVTPRFFMTRVPVVVPAAPRAPHDRGALHFPASATSRFGMLLSSLPPVTCDQLNANSPGACSCTSTKLSLLCLSTRSGCTVCIILEVKAVKGS
ncbi:hypothetical protein C8R45DRAFT_941352 [Mycena sanguinolenta]|nr:hypothetical protein C8R45DRAFT_941352 [Mycena sanguinolenta]